MDNKSNVVNCIDLNNHMNQEIYNRNIPSGIMETQLTPRPVYTKHTILPLVDNAPQIQRKSLPAYNIKTTFNPGTSAPWSGYASNINTESMLRNQLYPYRKNDDTHTWVPDTTSDLYNIHWKYVPKDNVPFVKLYEKPIIAPEQFKYSKQVGYALFNNSTRNQIKDLNI